MKINEELQTRKTVKKRLYSKEGVIDHARSPKTFGFVEWKMDAR